MRNARQRTDLNNIGVRFGAAVKERRNQLNLSQEQLAHCAGLHRTYISAVERGARNVSLENIRRLAEALHISIADLFHKYQVEEKKR